jgi:hypothetical protein
VKAIESNFSQRLLMLAVVFFAAACVCQNSATTATTPQFLVVTSTRSTEDREGPAPEDGESALTSTPTSEINTTATGSPVTMTAGQELSCVTGPHWALYEWVAKILEGETVTLLAKAPEEWAEYYYVRKADGTECWAFGGSSIIDGDTYLLPVREAPPLPEVVYRIENGTGLFAIAVYIREKDSPDWGPNRLSALFLAGDTFSITLTAGFYDVLVLDGAEGVLYEEYGRPIGSDPAYRYTLLNMEIEFYIQNDFSFNLCTFRFRPQGGDWMELHGPSDDPVAPGGRVWFTLPAGFYAFEAKNCSGFTNSSISGLYIGPALPGGFTVGS